jgi:hypothetical protein
MIDVVCTTCYRHEQWDVREGAHVCVGVVMEGGTRRPGDDPQWVRGRTALASFRGEIGPVVEVCSQCGQLMVARGDLPRMDVRVDTPEGSLEIAAKITGPDGEMTADDADAWLEQQYKVPFTKGLLGDLGRSSFFLVLLLPFFAWLGSMVFVVSFLASIWEGAPEAVRGVPGYDVVSMPEGTPTPVPEPIPGAVPGPGEKPSRQK